MTDLELLRHAVATLGYRAAKTMRGALASFADFKPGPTSKTPVQIVAHMVDLFDWALTLVQGEWKWNTWTPLPWDQECARFLLPLSDLTMHSHPAGLEWNLRNCSKVRSRTP